jgi:uncharacterized membrane protein YfcA
MIQSICGFGSGVFAMSVLPHFFHSYSFSLVLSSLFSLVMSILIAIREYRHINIRTTIPIIIGGAFAITSIMFFWSVNADVIMKKVLGYFLILFSLYSIFSRKNIKIKPTFKAGIFFGMLSGAANSFFSVGGPPVAVYMLSASKNNKEYLASLQAYFCFSSSYVTILRYMKGMITEDVWPLFFAGLPFLAFGTWAGLKLFGMLNENMLRIIVYTFMAVSGAVLVLTN